MVRQTLTGLWAVGLGCAAGAAPDANPQAVAGLTVRAGELAIATGEDASPAEARAAALVAGEITRRAGLAVAVGPTARARYTLVTGTTESSAGVRGLASRRASLAPPGPDGFRVDTAPDAEGRLLVLGQSPSGVVAGLGEFLRQCRYADGTLTIPALALASTPRLPVRGIYLATHFHNFYHVAPLAEVDAVIEEFALWGGNSLTVWFDMHHFAGLDDPVAQTQLARLRHFGETAHGVGMKFGLAFLANEAYNTSPESLRAKWLPGWPHYHVEVCPSTPEGLALIGKWQAELLAAFPAVDFIWTWPYDQGGCACDACKPWGANGFLRASEQLARLFRERFPRGDVWLSTWLFDGLEGASGEYAGFLDYLRTRQPEWLSGILTGTHRDVIPHQLLGRPRPERYPLTCFPEISMYAMNPWGGYGANPLPGFCARLAADMRGHIQGGWPYSEGIYEDLNKFFFCRYFWAPEAEPDRVLSAYAAHYFAPDVAGEASRLFRLLEQTHARSLWRVQRPEGAEEAWALAQAIDARLAPWARQSWRWRLVYVRAAMDSILKAQGFRSPEAQAALEPLCAELRTLYHADPARTFIRPPDFPRPRPADATNQARGRPVTASSCNAGYQGSEQALVDGTYAEEDGENFWVHDPQRERTAWVTIDLGQAAKVREVRLQFRGIFGVFWFVPVSVAVSTSPDGTTFSPAVTSDRVPKEGAEYAPALWSYPLGQEGRYVRIELGPSQHVQEPYAGTLELVEVEVIGE
jgi:hypothetical protein